MGSTLDLGAITDARWPCVDSQGVACHRDRIRWRIISAKAFARGSRFALVAAEGKSFLEPAHPKPQVDHVPAHALLAVQAGRHPRDSADLPPAEPAEIGENPVRALLLADARGPQPAGLRAAPAAGSRAARHHVLAGPAEPRPGNGIHFATEALSFDEQQGVGVSDRI